MTRPSNNHQLGTELYKLAGIDPDELGPATIEAFGAAAVKLATVLVLERFREPREAMLEAAAKAPAYTVLLDSAKARADLESKAKWQAMISKAIEMEREDG